MKSNLSRHERRPFRKRHGKSAYKKKTYQMKMTILSIMLLITVCLSCTDKRQQIQIGTAPGKETAGTDAGDTVASVQVNDKHFSADKYPAVYDIPECYLWYVKDLPDEYKGKPVSMWTEHHVYNEDVQDVNVFVVNPDSVSLLYGRSWLLEKWNGKEWVIAKTRGDLAWFDDAFGNEKAPLLYCFRFPVDKYYQLSKGKYRINKKFYAKRKEIKLYAEFEVK